MARAWQPSVVYIDDCERTWVKKIPKTDKVAYICEGGLLIVGKVRSLQGLLLVVSSCHWVCMQFVSCRELVVPLPFICHSYMGSTDYLVRQMHVVVVEVGQVNVMHS